MRVLWMKYVCMYVKRTAAPTRAHTRTDCGTTPELGSFFFKLNCERKSKAGWLGLGKLPSGEGGGKKITLSCIPKVSEVRLRVSLNVFQETRTQLLEMQSSVAPAPALICALCERGPLLWKGHTAGAQEKGERFWAALAVECVPRSHVMCLCFQ